MADGTRVDWRTMAAWVRTRKRRLIPPLLALVAIVTSIVVVANGSTPVRDPRAQDATPPAGDRAQAAADQDWATDDAASWPSDAEQQLPSPLPSILPTVSLPPILPTTTPSPSPLPGPEGDPANLATGVKAVDNASSTTTGVIEPEAGGSVLVWIAGLSAGNDPSPIPTVTGAGMAFTLVEAAGIDNPDAPRRLSLFIGHPGPSAGRGALTISWGRTLGSSEWFWSIVQTEGTTVAQSAVYQEKDFVTTNTTALDHQTVAGNQTIAGFVVGMEGDVRPAAPYQQIAETSGKRPRATVFSSWTEQRVDSASCTWDEPAHSIGIVVEMT